MSEDTVLVQLERAIEAWDAFVDAVVVQKELEIERREAEWSRAQQQAEPSH